LTFKDTLPQDNPLLRRSQLTAPNPRTEAGSVNSRRRIWIALAVVIVTQGIGVAFQSVLIPRRVRPLHHKLAELPAAADRSLGKQWIGTEAHLDPRIFEAVGADEQINLTFTNTAGKVVASHCATWLSTFPGMPHSPEECYTGCGWELLDLRMESLPNRPKTQIALASYQRLGRRIVIAYWYQMDERTFVDRNSERTVRRGYWGRKEWPPLTKTLLQTDSDDDAKARILDLAAVLYDFNRTL
jgi:uncharacterized protein YjeT (DUF2065 family)